jgi:hypothetical protein
MHFFFILSFLFPFPYKNDGEERMKREKSVGRSTKERKKQGETNSRKETIRDMEGRRRKCRQIG